MKSLLKLEWKRYLITACIIMVMMIIRTNLYHEGLQMDHWVTDRDKNMEFAGYTLELYEEEVEDKGLFVLSVGDILPVIMEKEIMYIPIGVYLIFVFVDDFVKRKKNYNELERTFPVKTWKRYLFYYLADALLIIIPCCGDVAYRCIAMKVRFGAVGIEIPWIWKLCCKSLVQIVAFLLVVLAIFSFVRMLVVSRMWKLPIGIVVFVVLTYLVECTPTDSFLEKCVSILVDDRYHFENYNFDSIIWDDYTTDDEVIKIIGDEYEKTLLDWYNKLFSYEYDPESDSYNVKHNMLPVEELYKGELNPKYQVLYHGEPIQKDYAKKFIVEDYRYHYYCSIDLYRFDMQLCLLQKKYENYDSISDIIRVIIAFVWVALMCGLSGKCHGQKSILYFTWARYLAGILVGIVMFEFCKIGFDDSHIAIVALESIVLGAACIWLLTPERKRIFEKKKERIM